MVLWYRFHKTISKFVLTTTKRLTSKRYLTFLAEHWLIFLFSTFHFFVVLAEQRQRLAADLRMRQYHEEQMNKFENYAEEENDGEFVVARARPFWLKQRLRRFKCKFTDDITQKHKA